MLKALGRLFGGRGEGTGTPVCEVVEQPDVAALLSEAYRFCDSGDLARAEDLLEQAIGQRPDCAEAYVVLGQLQQRRGALDEAADAYTLACHHAPQMQKAALFLGMLLLERGDEDAARQALERAVALDPADAVAVNALGAAQFKSGLRDAAVANFRKALALKPDFAEAHTNLGYLLFRDGEEYDEGEAHIRAALDLDPDNETFLCNQAMVLQQRGASEEALELCGRLLARNPALREVRFNRGVIRLARGAFDSGWADYEARPKLDRLPWPEWRGESLSGRSLVVYSEQGIGDEMMFASCLPELIAEAGHVTLACSAKMAGLFRLSFPQADIVVQQAGSLAWVLSVGKADVHVSAGSIPRYRRRSLADFPSHDGYLRADPGRVGYWRERLAALPGAVKVGISWRGGAATTRRSLRSIPLAAWAPVLGVPEASFVSLQYTDCAAELAALRAGSGFEVQHWPEAIDDYTETAALVSALDLVVSVQTAVVHLAGACGATAWVLIPRAPEWRYMEQGDRMPWYPSVTLFRQTAEREWEGPLRSVAQALAERVRRES